MEYLTLLRGSAIMSATVSRQTDNARVSLCASGGFGGAIHLDQHKARRIVHLLDHIEARDAGLLHAVARVLELSFAKRLDRTQALREREHGR